MEETGVLNQALVQRGQNDDFICALNTKSPCIQSESPSLTVYRHLYMEYHCTRLGTTPPALSPLSELAGRSN